jgi:hypothetical protein
MAKRVRIHSAGLDTFWYARNIGKVFEVEDKIDEDGDYVLLDSHSYISSEDCEVIEEETEEPKVEKGFIKVTNGRWWYERKVGQIFKVNAFVEDYDDEDLPFTTEAYKVVDPTGGENGFGYVLAQDCLEWTLPKPKDYAEDLGMVEVKAEEVVDPDMVNSPNHYTSGKFETIEIIKEVTKSYEDGFVAYCVGNSIKYLSRAPFKHADGGSEDLRKARKYLDFAIERLANEK